MITPIVTVVIAAYGRSNVVRHAIDSVRAQALEDWEVVVVDDASPDDTGAVVAAVDDPRVRYVRLPQNVGEQSGPNNVGAYLAASPLLAFLNQDDLWFPDHLSHLVELKTRTGAGVVCSVSAMAWPPPTEGDEELTFALRGWRDAYDPRFDHAASTWVVDRGLHLRLGGWKAAAQCYEPPSQDFLFRAWRSGAGVVLSRHLSVLAEGSGNRPGSYSERHESWQQRVAARLAADPEGFRREILATSGPLDAPRRAGTRWGRLRQRAAAVRIVALARLGRSPQERQYRAKGFGRGAYLRSLRRTRGLD